MRFYETNSYIGKEIYLSGFSLSLIKILVGYLKDVFHRMLVKFVSTMRRVTAGRTPISLNAVRIGGVERKRI